MNNHSIHADALKTLQRESMKSKGIVAGATIGGIAGLAMSDNDTSKMPEVAIGATAGGAIGLIVAQAIAKSKL